MDSREVEARISGFRVAELAEQQMGQRRLVDDGILGLLDLARCENAG